MWSCVSNGEQTRQIPPSVIPDLEEVKRLDVRGAICLDILQRQRRRAPIAIIGQASLFVGACWPTK